MRFLTEKVQPELVASKDASRPVLTKVHLNTEASRVEVNDSYMLARFPVELDEDDTSGPIPLDALKASRKAPNRHGGDVHIRANSHVNVTQDDAPPYFTVPRGPADYQFPNIDALIPDNLATFSIGLNAEKLHKLAKAMGVGPNDGIELRFTADNDGNPSPLRPILVRPLRFRGDENNPDGLLMPIRLRD